MKKGIKDLPNGGKCDSIQRCLSGNRYPISTPALLLKGREKSESASDSHVEGEGEKGLLKI